MLRSYFELAKTLATNRDTYENVRYRLSLNKFSTPYLTLKNILEILNADLRLFMKDILMTTVLATSMCKASKSGTVIFEVR